MSCKRQFRIIDAESNVEDHIMIVSRFAKYKEIESIAIWNGSYTFHYLLNRQYPAEIMAFCVLST